MRKTLIALLLVLCTTVGIAAGGADEGGAPGAGAAKTAALDEDRWGGIIQQHDKPHATLVVRKGNEDKQVIYNDATKLRSNIKKDVKIDALQAGSRVLCVGKFDAQGRLVATLIELQFPVPNR